MQASPSFVPPRHASRVVRKHLREKKRRISAKVMRRGMGWVMNWLRRRTGKSAAEVARSSDRAPQTLRDMEHGRFEDFGWCGAYDVCHTLRYSLPQVEALVRRYLEMDFVWQRQRHAGEAEWTYSFPWSKKRAKEDELQQILQSHARPTGFAARRIPRTSSAHENGHHLLMRLPSGSA